MTAKEFMDKYYTHEAIMKSIKLDKENNKITINIDYCEWQLEEMHENNLQGKGYQLIFCGVKNISNEDIFKMKHEFILVLKLTKTKAYLGFDLYGGNYFDCEFLYKTFEVKDIK